MNRIITWSATTLTLALGSVIATVAADGPDVIVSLLHPVPVNYGSEDPNGNGDYISAFSVGINFCNIGTEPFDVYAFSNQQALVFESMYRLRQGAFEQIGMSWVFNGEFYALNQQGCGLTCTAPNPNPNPGTALYPGCSDPHSASIVGNRTYLGPSWEIDARTGYFPWPPTPASGSGTIANRLQVHNFDLDPTLNPGATYFIQTHSIHPQDAASGNGNNNASYARITIAQSGTNPNVYNGVSVGATQQMQSAIRAWKDNDPVVVETDAQVPGEGLFILSAKVTDLGDGYWHYEYALQNLNSDRSGGSFTVPISGVAGVASIRNVGFHDVDYHDGDGVSCPGCVCAGGAHTGQPCIRNSDCPSSLCNGSHINFDGTDWLVTVDRCGNKLLVAITWSTTSYAVDPNANALRWGTLYNFRFDTNVPPEPSAVRLDLFKPGIPHQIWIATIGPLLPLIPFVIGDSDCDGDVDLFDAGSFQACFSGAIGTSTFVASSVGCLLRFDFDYDGDVDLADYKVFFWAYTRP